MCFKFVKLAIFSKCDYHLKSLWRQGYVEILVQLVSRLLLSTFARFSSKPNGKKERKN
jgi:hypothetical protein